MVVKLRLQYCQSDNIIVNNNWHLAVCLIKKVPIIQSKRLGKKRTFLHDGSKLANHQTKKLDDKLQTKELPVCCMITVHFGISNG